MFSLRSFRLGILKSRGLVAKWCAVPVLGLKTVEKKTRDDACGPPEPPHRKPGDKHKDKQWVFRRGYVPVLRTRLIVMKNNLLFK